MTAHRTAVPAVVAGAAALLFPALTAAPAAAHGAPTGPLSRAAACGPEGGAYARSAACRAAVAANKGQPLGAWDNLRRADTGGRERERRVIPDGRLCSAGLDAHRGLDTPRTDWPVTELSAGSRLTLGYEGTIPHPGTFDLYLTRPGYDPSSPLTWSDLDSKPFASVTGPQLADGSYRIRGRLPADRTGRHLLYTVWRTTDSSDTYYSCSDLLLVPAGTAGGAGDDDGPRDRPARDRGERGGESAPGPAGKTPATESAGPDAAGTPEAPDAGEPADGAAGAGDDTPRPAPRAVASSFSATDSWLVPAGAAALLAGGAAVVTLLLRRRRS
ncbi:lytic polysaccharide monooxygenase [Streptomyces sp. WAC 00631]|uniref:lytic polysaccharide monooxygenase n=1 Tax=unclassified Streptomyces TaxID=2593676 RepID=UPI000F7990C9|nr:MULTISPECIES: lytic polysaccharide monooxygenase [unclassified Streptomyces]MCC5033805.1 lytic polysaccharide monooxygenase [Streptomyces sp. WAC 00631]MCC9742808.1 lytic polysaccharide monooxygenase [Streptomyces sp. MNU89]